MSEEEFLRIVDRIAGRLAPKFRFGYHSVEDMKQQARLEAIKGLEKYDNTRPLENFLWIHIRNRLFNFKRDNYERPDKPCFDCPFNAYDRENDECREFEDFQYCELYDNWVKRNERRRNIMMPIELTNVDDHHEENMKIYDQDKADKEMLEIIDRELPIQYRHDYLRLKHGMAVSKYRKAKLKQIISDIVDKYYGEET